MSAGSFLVRTPHNSERSRIGTHHAISQTKTARRQRSLQTGARAWAAEVRYRGGALRGAALLTLTFGEKVSDSVAAASLRSFWDRYGKEFGRHQRLSWLEYQANGRHHYHAIVIDAPAPWQGHTGERLNELWGRGRTNVLWRNAEWVDHKALAYAISYAKKFGQKEYQQAYEGASKAVRTFHTNRLRSPDARCERLPRWAFHAAREVGRRIVDGRRARGGGLYLSVSGGPDSDPSPSVATRLRINHWIDWWDRASWPPGSIVVTLGDVVWTELDKVG